MSLTSAQKTALKTHIEASVDPVITQALSSGAMNVIQGVYNTTVSPDYYFWRSSMNVSEIRELVDWDEVVAQNTNTLLSFQVLTSATSVNPANASVRQAFASIFSGPGGLNSRTALSDAAKETGTLAETILSLGTGTGAVGDPDAYGFEGSLGYQDISAALQEG